MIFSLTGYDSIPTDGSGRVFITDINPNGDNNEDALICHSEIPISSVGDWFLHPIEMSNDTDDRINTFSVSMFSCISKYNMASFESMSFH